VPKPIHTPEQFGEALRERRRRLGITQEELANVSGVSRKSVIDIEGGKPNAQLHIALRLAQAVGLDVVLRPR
jgi:HTH-type transcriptional regulator / antitoxin HipB